ncbi:MAG: PAS domain S-box protein [Candidatus Bathyarchaeota archaeon]|nr:PAS domain S-box protein [Candidatus Bathyarchaeota archaeon]
MSQTGQSNPEDAIHVLHVDDEQGPLKFTKSFVELSDSTIQVESVASPEAALRRLDEGHFDCIVSDYQMPGLNGIELAVRIRETSDIPIIIYTGRGSEEVASKAFAAGIDDYMRKEIEPSHYEVLTRRIRSAVDRHRSEKNLIDSLVQYQVLYTSVSDAITLIDPVTHKILSANPTTLQTYGMKESELIGRHCYEVFHGLDFFPASDCPVSRLSETGNSADTVFQHVGIDGEVRHIEVTVHGIRDELGELVQVVHVSRDVTEQKRIEEALRKYSKMGERDRGVALDTSKFKGRKDLATPVKNIDGGIKSESPRQDMPGVVEFLVNNSQEVSSFIILIIALFFLSEINFLFFHSLVEIFSIVVAGTIFCITWNSRKILDNNYLKFLGISFIFIGFIDLVHLLAYKGMGVWPEFDANLPTQLWIAARSLQALTLLIAPLTIKRKVYVRTTIVAYSSVVILLLLSLFVWQVFPTCFVEGVGLTPFKINSEYIISAILAVSAFLLYKEREVFDKHVLRLIIFSIFTTICSELAFTFYVSVFGFSNVVGHFLKVITFYLIYKAIVKIGIEQPFNVVFRNQVVTNEKLSQALETVESARATLKSSEEKYRSLFENMLDGFAYCKIVLNEDNKPVDFIYLEINDAFETLTGLKRENVAGKNVSEAIPGAIEAHRELLEVYGKVALTGMEGRLEIYFKPLNIWLDISVYSPEKGYFVAVFENVTDRKRMEEELAEKEKRFRKVSELIPDYAYSTRVESDGSYVPDWITDGFTRMFGFTSEEVKDSSVWSNQFYPEDVPILEERFRKLTSNKKTIDEYRLFTREGDMKWVRDYGHPEWDEDEKRVVRVYGAVQDITDRKRMEEELKQHSEHLEEIVKEKTMELSVSEERLRSFMASAPDAFTLYDSELNCLDVNQALLKYWPEGTRKEDLIGKNILDLSPYIKETGRYDRYLDVIKTGKPFQIEDPPAHPFLGDARLSLRAFKVGEGLGIITTDITDQKRMEEQLVEAERMSAMGRVSAMVGHDLRGPLQTIMNALYMMEKTPEQTGELRGKIKDSVNYATRILDDLRYSTGDVPVHLQETNVGALLQKIITSSTVPDNIRVDLDVSEELTSVRLDPLMAQRVLDNLIRNSVEAMADGGVLSLSAYKEPDGVVIRVSDTGTGITEEELERIFTLFFTSKPGGTGLGLAYCKRAVEAHGGTITVESEVGRGTTFTVRIPIMDE